MIADWIDAELRNWARWCHAGPWPHPIPPDHAASLEGRYIAPIIEDEDAAQPWAPAPNRQRAEIVHDVYMTRLTTRERRRLRSPIRALSSSDTCAAAPPMESSVLVNRRQPK